VIRIKLGPAILGVGLLAIIVLAAAGILSGWPVLPGGNIPGGELANTTPTPEVTPLLTPAYTPNASPSPTNSPASSPTPEPIATATPFQEATPTPTPVSLGTPTADDILHLGAHTDKVVYGPGEEMRVTVSVNARREIQAAYIWIYGLENAWNARYLNRKYPATLKEGENEFNSTFILPDCSSCSGISYGEHSFDVIVLADGIVLKTATTRIEIRPD